MSAPPGPSSLSQVSPAGPLRRTGADNWNRPVSGARPRADPGEAEQQSRRQVSYGDEPAYTPVLVVTAGWYAIPALLYLIWLLTMESDQRGVVGRELVSSLPWLFGAVAMSLAVATLLRWATVGWRTLTLSFAAAVIGAGVATIAHSLVL
jgi:hypothetical protein